MIDYLGILIKKYGGILIAGVAGAIIRRIRENMTIIEFLQVLFLGIFAVTSLGGRAWCGWACPQTIFRVIYRDLIESTLLGLRRIKNKQKEPDLSKAENKTKKVSNQFLCQKLVC